MGGRPHQVSVGFSAEELAVVSAAAERAGLAVGAWVGQEIVRVASGVKRSAPAPVWRENAQELMRLESELMEQRRVLRNVGGNLNDVARHANVTGQLHAATGQVLGLVARVVTQVERTVVAVSDLAVATMTGVITAATSRSATPEVTDLDTAPAAAPVTQSRPRPTPYPRGRDGVGPA